MRARLGIALMLAAVVAAPLPAPSARAEAGESKAEKAKPKDDKDKDKPKDDKDKAEKGEKAKHDEDAEDEDEDEKGEKKGEKGEKADKDKARHADEELFGGDEKHEIEPARLEEHAKKERAAARAKVAKILDGAPMTAELREELQRHALATAKLARIRVLAEGAKDAASVTKVKELVQKENERHKEFVVSFKAKAAVKGGAK